MHPPRASTRTLAGCSFLHSGVSRARAEALQPAPLRAGGNEICLAARSPNLTAIKALEATTLTFNDINSFAILSVPVALWRDGNLQLHRASVHLAALSVSGCNERVEAVLRS